MAKYAFIFIDDGSDHDRAPTPEEQAVYAQIFKWFETNGDKIVSGGAELQGAHTATTVRRNAGRMSIVDGPFIEAKESVGGFSIVEAPDLDAAVALAKTWPGHAVEVRPIVEH